MVVSGAAGAVGSLVGQIAKIKVGLLLDCKDQGCWLVILPRSGWSLISQIAKIKVGLWLVRLLMSCLKFPPCHL